MSSEHIEVLTIADHNSDGSAGVPADLHAFYARGVYGMGLLTAAVAGNLQGIFAQQLMSLDFIQKQFDVLSDDFKVEAVKTGILADKNIIDVVVKSLKHCRMQSIILDLMIIIKHGAALLTDDAYQAFLKELVPLATIITSNFFGAQKLTGLGLRNKPEVKQGAKLLQKMGAENVLAKGSRHNDRQTGVRDCLLLGDSPDEWLTKPYFRTDRVSDTGDTLLAVIAAEPAKGNDVRTAVKTAKDFAYEALSHPVNAGARYSPINHLAAQEEVKQ